MALLAVTLATPSLNVFRSGDDNVLQWTVSNTKLDSFRIEKKVDAGAWGTMTTKAAGDRSQADVGVTAPGTYTYRVVAIRGGRERTSNEAGYTVTGDATLLTEADFTYAGAFKTPTSAGGFSTSFGACPLTLRNTAGTDRLLSSCYAASGRLPWRVYEMDIPALSMGPTYNTATVHRFWGELWTTDIVPSVPNGQLLFGLFWDSVDSRLYYSWGPMYSNTEPMPTFGYATLDDGTGVATPVAGWSVSGVNHKMVKGGMLRIPDAAFVTANCPGKPLVVGFGSLGFSLVSPGSAGPALFAIAPPDVGTHANGTAVPTQELLSHPYNSSGTIPTNPLRSRRAPDYEPGIHGVLAGATSTTITLGTDWYDTSVKNYNDGVMTLISGAGSGQTGRVLSAGSGRTYTVTPAWDTTPAIGDSYEVRNVPGFSTWTPSGETGYLTLGDKIYSSVAWINNGVKHGIAVLWTLATGLQSYGPGGPHYQGFRHWMSLYDPADLAAVAQGTQTNYLVDPYESFDFSLPTRTDPMGRDSAVWSNGRYAGGLALNAAHTRLYIGSNRGNPDTLAHPTVEVFDIAN